MAGLTGQQKQLPNANPGTTNLDQLLTQYFANTYTQGLNPTLSSPDMQYWQGIFDQQNQLTQAQAKEGAGNLTGSGYGNYLGKAAGRSATDQGMFLADLMDKHANRYLAGLLGTLNSPAGGVTNAYQPGFLDYLSQAAGEVAPGIGSYLGASAGAGGGSANTSQYGNRTQSQ